MSYTPLHVHTEYSLLDGMSTVQELFDRAKELGMPGLAITDHGTMMGCKAFCDYGKRYAPEVKPIIGDEIYLTAGYDHRLKDEDHKHYYHLILLAKNQTGYRNLCKIASIGGTEGLYKGRARVCLDVIRQYHEGLICMSACIGGEVPQCILDDDMEGAEAAIRRYQEIFGEDFYLEVCEHPSDREGKPQEVLAYQRVVSEALFVLGKKYNIPVVATNDSHFTLKEQAEAHDTMLAINCGKKVSDTDRLHYTGEEYLKSEQEMLSVFPNHPEAIYNTRLICDKVELYDIDAPKVVPLPRAYKYAEDSDALLDRHVWEAYSTSSEMLEEPDAVRERLKEELDVICRKGFSRNYLIMEDMLAFARKEGIVYGPGRSSAAGSMVAFILGITKVNPMKHGLLFERFINENTVEFPGIDTDFEVGGQKKIWEYLKQSYGEDCVAGQVTIQTLSGKAAFTNACAALDIPEKAYGSVLRLIEQNESYTYQNGVRHCLEPLLNKNESLRDKLAVSPTLAKAYEIATALEGRRNGKGTHACSFFVSRTPIADKAPITLGEPYFSGEMIPVVQYEKYQADDTGLTRINVLELRTLSVIKDTLAEIKEKTGNAICLDDMAEDLETSLLMRFGDKTGVFLFETEWIKEFLGSFQSVPTFDDMVALNALYRPGSLDKIPEFIRRKNAGQSPETGIPELDDILKETYGVIVFQEQYIRFFETFLGKTPEEAVKLWKALIKLKNEEIRKGESEMLAKGRERNLSERDVIRAWYNLCSFAPYSFQKSHSVCYVSISWQCAYLKAHYGDIFKENLERML